MLIRVMEPTGELVGVLPNLGTAELAGRTCYRSEDKITDNSAARFIGNIVQHGHESVIEHINVSAFVVCSRACSHQIVRHRLVSYSQESQRYCNYCDNKFGNTFEVIAPKEINLVPGTYDRLLTGNWGLIRDMKKYKEVNIIDESNYYEIISPISNLFLDTLNYSFVNYVDLIKNHELKPEDARFVLPNACRTQLVMTTNLREWRHIFSVRCDSHAQWEIRGIMLKLLKDMYEAYPTVFQDQVEKVLS